MCCLLSMCALPLRSCPSALRRLATAPAVASSSNATTGARRGDPFTDDVRFTLGANRHLKQQPTLRPQRRWPAASPRSAEATSSLTLSDLLRGQMEVCAKVRMNTFCITAWRVYGTVCTDCSTCVTDLLLLQCMRSLSGGDTDAVPLTLGVNRSPRQQPTLWPQRRWPAASPRNAATLCAQKQGGRLQEAGEAAAAATACRSSGWRVKTSRRG